MEEVVEMHNPMTTELACRLSTNVILARIARITTVTFAESRELLAKHMCMAEPAFLGLLRHALAADNLPRNKLEWAIAPSRPSFTTAHIELHLMTNMSMLQTCRRSSADRCKIYLHRVALKTRRTSRLVAF